ncbi:hypothetical protein EN780_19855 [Mesorhizobium sp. M4B.F.Ca.ET.089.01.1.1]|uniref:sulfotransferase family protein n=1 Tax=Mesorhizobium sp. M4B.F.Ca.ET.089.01.1.1 TaxID=2496662 RepID=UPI000FE3D0D4|nr:sulfotransferase domain-containing protein [Mesorhizobium sp. M4B.F.Ca.ET.089.01.1.1]RWX64809.1 hypothetical protein EN780_19855 [Mesorhizobium sp. M4B.F.Ca.ET.089.01.1.1]
MSNYPSSGNLHDATPQAAEAAPKAAKRTCIMVIGMHRSGTSALTRAISLLGAELPKTMLGANPTNEEGHWEPQRLMELNDRMLAELGSRWDDWRSLDPNVLIPGRLQFYQAEIAQLIDEEYGSASLFVLKEPRISRFVPLYMGVMKQMRIDVRYVLIGRNPLAVIASLAKRDEFTVGFSSLLWLRHALEAEHATRGQPRIFLSYEGMFDQWREGIDGITSTLKIDWPLPKAEWSAALSNHFADKHQHHAASRGQLEADPRIDDWIKQVYGAVKVLEEDQADAAAMSRLDAVRGAFDSLNPVFGAAFFAEISAREKAAAERLAQQRCAADEQVAELERNRAEAAARGAQLTEQLNDLQRLAEEQKADAAAREADLRANAKAREADLMAKADSEALRANDAESQLESVAEQLKAAQKETIQIKNSHSWRVMYPVRYLKSLLRSDAG